MWDNIGCKLQGLAKVICWLGIIGSVIAAIVLWSQNSRYQSTILLGILYLVVGCLASWIGSWAMYGLGLVVEHVENYSIQSNYLSTNKQYVATPVQNTNSSKSVQNSSAYNANVVLSDGDWKCDCGRINRNYASICACGKRRIDVIKG